MDRFRKKIEIFPYTYFPFRPKKQHLIPAYVLLNASEYLYPKGEFLRTHRVGPICLSALFYFVYCSRFFYPEDLSLLLWRRWRTYFSKWRIFQSGWKLQSDEIFNFGKIWDSGNRTLVEYFEGMRSSDHANGFKLLHASTLTRIAHNHLCHRDYNMLFSHLLSFGVPRMP